MTTPESHKGSGVVLFRYYSAIIPLLSQHYTGIVLALSAPKLYFPLFQKGVLRQYAV